jgi:hypothetical protein
MAKIVWVLGSEHPNAHKSISWLSSFPNFSNCDVLIVNLQSLEEEVLKRRQADLSNQARKYIFDMLMTRKKEVIVVLSANQDRLSWLPLYPLIKTVAPIKIKKDEELGLDFYFKTVEDCTYYIHDFNLSYVKALTDPRSTFHEKYHFTESASEGYSLEYITDLRIENVAEQIIGGIIKFRIDYGFLSILHGGGTFVSGPILFLPPPTKVSAEQAIDLIVNTLIGAEIIESPPSWEGKIDLPGLKVIDEEIQRKEKEKEAIVKEIEKLQNERDNLIKLRRLLWTKGTPLENAVRDAFILLGFPGIRKIREENLEDWVIEFKHIKQYQYGVFEIKGVDERTSLADLTQCNKWVEDYLLENKKAKGIFVTNQYRLEDPSKNQEKREHFEKNEMEYAEKREICILPTHEIFYAVIAKLNGDPEITRKYIEEKIANAKGLCKFSKT